MNVQILEGEYERTVGGKKFVAKPGATIFARCGVEITKKFGLEFLPPPGV